MQLQYSLKRKEFNAAKGSRPFSPWTTSSRPRTAGESLENAAEEIDVIVKQRRNDAVPYVHEDIPRPSTFPGKNNGRTNRPLPSRSAQDRVGDRFFSSMAETVSRTNKTLPMQMGALKGSKFVHDKINWHSVRTSPEARDRKNREITQSLHAKQLPSPGRQSRGENQRLKKSDTVRFIERLRPRTTVSPIATHKMIRISSKLTMPGNSSYVEKKGWKQARPWTSSPQPIPGVKQIELVEKANSMETPIIDGHSAEATLKRWHQYANALFNYDIERRPHTIAKERLRAVKKFASDPVQSRSYDCKDRLALAVSLANLELLMDTFLEQDANAELRDEMKIIHSQILKSLFPIQEFLPRSDIKASFANKSNENQYYLTPTFRETSEYLQKQRDNYRDENDKLMYTLSKTKSRIYQLERELGTSHKKNDNAVLEDELSAVRALAMLEESSQYRIIHLAMNRVQKKPAECQKSDELKLKYNAEAQAGLIDILRSCAKKLDKDVVLETLNTMWDSKKEHQDSYGMVVRTGTGVWKQDN
jgi:hypothetical protein